MQTNYSVKQKTIFGVTIIYLHKYYQFYTVMQFYEENQLAGFSIYFVLLKQILAFTCFSNLTFFGIGVLKDW